MAKINISDLTVSRSQLEELSEQELASIGGGGRPSKEELAYKAYLALLKFLKK